VLALLIPMIGRVLAIVPAKYVIAVGGIVLAAALFYSMNLVPDIDYYHLALFRAAQSAALAFLFVPISTVAYTTVPEELNGDATALFSMARNVVGGFGISISTAWITDREQIRQETLVDSLTPGNQPYPQLLHQVENALAQYGSTLQHAIQSAPGQINSILQAQAATLAYIDVFLITGCISLLFFPTALMLSDKKATTDGTLG
jgi:MFS transporter, DHA2 family, multidrug resistance protein